jgi:hypothetical protein
LLTEAINPKQSEIATHTKVQSTASRPIWAAFSMENAMPRTNGVYSPPAGTKGVPNTTVRSAPYNSLIDDLTQDANAPRPITAGGTGASNATQARESLGAIGSADIIGASLKGAPVDADAVVISDSEDNVLRRVLWSRVKSIIVSASSIGAVMMSGTWKSPPADGDFFSGVQAAGSPLFRITWGQIKSWLGEIFYNKSEVNAIVSGNMGGRAYPRRADGAGFNLNWGDPGGQETYVVGSTNGTSFRPVHRDSLQVGYASVAGNANLLGGSLTASSIQTQLNARVSDTRFAGYTQASLNIPTTGGIPNSVMEAVGYVHTSTWGAGGTDRNLYFGMRQPQINIPNVGWRAYGTWS